MMSPWREPAIEVVVAVEDDVLRRLDAAEPDQRDVAQLVVLLERAALPSSVGGGGGSA